MSARSEDFEDDFTLSQLANAEQDAEPVSAPSRRRAEDGENFAMQRGKVFNDPVHGHFYLPNWACDVIDTPEFQRLRDIKQLGTTFMVFPGATHTRFEHSLGTAWLASCMFYRIHNIQRGQLGLDARDGIAVSLAGLSHDLGHGPFSHVFDNEFIPRRLGKGQHWKHEHMSAAMLEHIIDANSIDMDRDLLNDAKQLITAEESGGMDKNAFLSEIVANKRNSVDVDKFDYIQRDSLYCGLKTSCDFQRLMKFCKVIDDEICYKANEVYNLYELFHSRASLHQRVYNHQKGKGIEFMLVDALEEADIAWNSAISSCIHDPKDFKRLDDTILKRIELSKEPELKKARSIVDRIRRRDLYKFVNEFTVPKERVQDFVVPSAEDITTCQRDNDVPGGLKPEDVIVQNLKIDWTTKHPHKNPCDYVNFFRQPDSQEKFDIARDKVSNLFPETFLDRKVRVYSRKNDTKYINAVADAFEEYQMRALDSPTQPHCTPTKPSRKRARSTSQTE